MPCGLNTGISEDRPHSIELLSQYSRKFLNGASFSTASGVIAVLLDEA